MHLAIAFNKSERDQHFLKPRNREALLHACLIWQDALADNSILRVCLYKQSLHDYCPTKQSFADTMLLENKRCLLLTFSRHCLTLYICRMNLKMNSMMSFQERAKLGMEQLSKQSPVTLAKARRQARMLSTQSISKNKRQRVSGN